MVSQRAVRRPLKVLVDFARDLEFLGLPFGCRREVVPVAASCVFLDFLWLGRFDPFDDTFFCDWIGRRDM